MPIRPRRSLVITSSSRDNMGMPITRNAVVSERIIFLLAGIPATGKSSFARYLALEHGFAHYDLESYPRGWPHPELKEKWDTDRPAFVAQVRHVHDRIALDWGFPVSCLSWVKELQALGVQLIWFDGDVARARQAFVRRGGFALNFDRQVAAIKKAGYPTLLDCLIVPALSASGVFLEEREIESIVFG
jgi:hypothetical protein